MDSLDTVLLRKKHEAEDHHEDSDVVRAVYKTGPRSRFPIRLRLRIGCAEHRLGDG